jgi:hypothetical protein
VSRRQATIQEPSCSYNGKKRDGQIDAMQFATCSSRPVAEDEDDKQVWQTVSNPDLDASDF